MSDERLPRVAIIDYGLGNLFSVKQACEQAEMHGIITSDRREILTADAAILPGVGAFGDAMETLTRLDLVGVLRDVVASQKPLVGICLGLQLLMSVSHEFGYHRGLGVVDGEVLSLREALGSASKVKVPHIGWSCIHAVGVDISTNVDASWSGSPLHGLRDGEFMYFVHSFYAKPSDPSAVLSVTRLGPVEFCSSLRRGNVFGCQFHPERSGSQGLRVYRNLAAMINQSSADRNDAREAGSEVRTA